MLKRSCGTIDSYPKQAQAYRFNRSGSRSSRTEMAIASGYARLFEALESRRLLSAALLETTVAQEPNTVDQLLELASGKHKNELTLQSSTTTTGTSSPTTVSAPPVLKTGLQPPPSTATTQSTSGSESGSGPGSRSPADFRYVLRPGSGFTGPTPTPAARGTGLGATRPAIADWDVVPYQSFNAALNVGVVAFHVNEAGIERVDFSANGGPWTSVRQMALNPQTNVVEYFATLRAELFSTGPVEVRAIAYPTVGQPVVLEPLKLYADPNDTFAARTRYVSTLGSDTTGNGTASAPFRTIAKAASSLQAAYGSGDGGTIYLAAGSYDASTGSASTSNSWLTIKAAPGVARTAVTITDISSRTRLVKFDNVTVMEGHNPWGSATNPNKVWYNDSDLKGTWRGDAISWGGPLHDGTKWVHNAYATGVSIGNCLDGTRSFRLVRNTSVRGIGSNFFSDSDTVINVFAADVNPDGINDADPPHPDVYHSYANTSNIIIYGVTATDALTRSRGIAMTVGADNVAIVNATVNAGGGAGMVFQFGGDVTNMLVKDSSFTGSAQFYTSWAGQTYTYRDVVVDNTTFSQSPGTPPGVIYR